MSDPKYRERYREYNRKYMKAYRALHAEYRERERERLRQDHENHPERGTRSKRAYRDRNPELSRQYSRQNSKAWKRAHPEEKRISKLRYEANSRGASGAGYTAEQWRIACEAIWQGCAYCKCRDQHLTVDHITPLTRGGSHNPENLAPACVSCNSSKGNRLLSEWRDGKHADIEQFAKEVSEYLKLLV